MTRIGQDSRGFLNKSVGIRCISVIRVLFSVAVGLGPIMRRIDRQVGSEPHIAVLPTKPEHDQQGADKHCAHADESGFRSEGSACPQIRPALSDGDDSCRAEVVAADRKTKNVALKKIPCDVKANRNGQASGQDISQTPAIGQPGSD